MGQLKLTSDEYSYAPQSADNDPYAETGSNQLRLTPDQYTFGPVEMEAPEPDPIEPVGDSSFSALSGGLKNTFRNLGSAFDVVSGDDEEIYEAAIEGTESTKSQKDFASTLSNYGDPDGVWDAVKNVGRAAWEEPKGAYHEILAQLPNSGAIIGSMTAGAAAGTFLGGPIGTVVGGIVGLMFGNSSIEIGALANEQAQMGEYDRGKTFRSGVIKGGVITAVDTATLGITKLLTGTVGRATTKAVNNVLIKNGVNLADDAAVMAAKANPAILKEMTFAGKEAAAKASKTIMSKAAIPSSFAGETLGEGVGEYFGSALAPDIEADLTDAVLESMMSLPQSAVEVVIGKGLNKLKKTGTPEEDLNLKKRMAENDVLQEKHIKTATPEDAKILASIEAALNDTDNTDFTEERVLALIGDERLAHLAPQLQEIVKSFQKNKLQTPIDEEHKDIVKESIKDNLSGIADKLEAEINAEMSEASGQTEFTPEEEATMAAGFPIEEPLSVDDIEAMDDQTIPVELSDAEKVSLVNQIIEIENRGTETDQDFADYDNVASQIEAGMSGKDYADILEARKKEIKAAKKKEVSLKQEKTDISGKDKKKTSQTKEEMAGMIDKFFKSEPDQNTIKNKIAALKKGKEEYKDDPAFLTEIDNKIAELENSLKTEKTDTSEQVDQEKTGKSDVDIFNKEHPGSDVKYDGEGMGGIKITPQSGTHAGMTINVKDTDTGTIKTAIEELEKTPPPIKTDRKSKKEQILDISKAKTETEKKLKVLELKQEKNIHKSDPDFLKQIDAAIAELSEAPTEDVKHKVGDSVYVKVHGEVNTAKLLSFDEDSKQWEIEFPMGSTAKRTESELFLEKPEIAETKKPDKEEFVPLAVEQEREETQAKQELLDLKDQTYEETGVDEQGNTITYEANAQEEVQRLDEQSNILGRILDCMGK